MSVFGHGPSRRETAILDMNDRGVKPNKIADQLNLSPRYVRQVIASLASPPVGNWQADARIGSDELLRALRRHHPDRCGVRA
jgi:hypothetical protein